VPALPYCQQRLSKIVFALRMLKRIVNEEALFAAYYAYFHTILCYNIEIWGQAPVVLIDRVFKLQKRQ